jgi:hypothetical protein
MHHSRGTRSELRFDGTEKLPCRREAVLANEREQLLRSYQKSDGIDKAKQPQNNEARQPIGISTGEDFLQEFVRTHNVMNQHLAETSNVEQETGLWQADALEDVHKTRIRSKRIPFRIDTEET